MKILCETQVVNRHTQANKGARAVKATLAVGFHSGPKDAAGQLSSKQLEMIHFTPQNKVGTRYKVTNNIDKVFTKFLKDGKATISFVEPPHNLMIKCDPIQLKAFLQTLKLGIDGKESQHLRLNIAATTAIPQKSQPQVKMTVLKRGDYPTKGFPKTLKTLIVQGIQMCRVSFDICSLRHLTVLNLSYNQISKLPPELGRLSLSEFYVNANSLGEVNSWQWLHGRPLQKSLRELDLSANKLTHFPPQLIKCEQLVTLKLNNNELQRLPFGLRRMRKLRYLHISTNKLQSLPATFNHAVFDLLDVWGNNFQPQIEYELDPRTDEGEVAAAAAAAANNNNEMRSTVRVPKVQSLMLLAARVVSRYKLPYSETTLPWILVDILSESPRCACGRLCYAGAVLPRAAMSTFNNVKNLIFSRDRLIYADIVLCGPTCVGRKQIYY